ncbi:hypothetical protein H1R20_g11211, partial [Candolleomyces eurysporus]
MAEDAQPPAFEPTSTVQLASQKDSKILSSEFKVNTGQNSVTITELPTVMDQQLFRTLDVTKLQSIIENYDAAAETLDHKVISGATMEWVSVPKRNAEVHLKAVVKNASEYTLLRGPVSVYVDGSFISLSDVPPPVTSRRDVWPSSRIGPSIRVTYHPLAKKLSQSGLMFISRTRNYVFSQRITVHNTKSLAIDNLTIMDQIPVSEESSITVKLLSPRLSLPYLLATGTASSNPFLKDTKEDKLGVRVPLPAKAIHGVVAQ